MSEEIPEANIVEGHSTVFVLAIITAFLALVGALLFVGYLKVKDSLPSFEAMDLPKMEFEIDSVSLPAVKIDELSQSIGEITETVTAVTKQVVNPQANRVSNAQYLSSYPSRIGFVPAPGKLQVYRDETELLFELQQPKDGISWIGVIHDPYAPLSNISGNPFFDQKTFPMIKRGTNVRQLFAANNQVNTFWQDLKPFTFFSESPDTIGFMVGTPRVMEFKSETTFYFIDLQRAFVATFKTKEVGFPRWVDHTVYPPSYATDKYIRLSQRYPGLGGVVIDDVRSFRDAEFQEDSELRAKLYLEEFKAALLNKNELQELAKREFDIDRNVVTEYINPLQKFVKLLYYGKRCGKQEALKELLTRVHPSLQKAVAKNDELNPNKP